MNKMKVLIVLGGTLSDCFFKKMYDNDRADYVIVADGALEVMDRTGLCFHSLVGDFDTVAPELLQKYEHRLGLYVERHIPEKNETDSELALRIALSKQPTEIIILGATGGRMDHTIGNIHLMYQCMKQGIPCAIYDEWNKIQLIQNETVLDKKTSYGTYVSFLPFFESAQGVTLKGFRYPLTDANLEKGTTLAISNEIEAESASVVVEKGVLICIESKDPSKSV